MSTNKLNPKKYLGSRSNSSSIRLSSKSSLPKTKVKKETTDIYYPTTNAYVSVIIFVVNKS